ncbi:MAG: hypothetical protein HY314_12045 [Acidobacteria bacterium]|nr:hypothetical protein [Acidobacteriota bacterium]
MTLPHGAMPSPADPLMLRAWRDKEEERDFVRAWLGLQDIPERSLSAAALFHHATSADLSRASWFFSRLAETQVYPQPHALRADDPLAQVVEGLLWAFLQSGKLVLDSLAREINLVYWHLDDEDQFYDPVRQARWASFYMVRQKLLTSGPFRDDPVSKVLERETIAETPEPAYRVLSHLTNVSVVVPMMIGPILAGDESQSGPLPLSRCRIMLPDDSRLETLTYDQGFEANEVGRMILLWLDRFLDEVYAALSISLKRMR